MAARAQAAGQATEARRRVGKVLQHADAEDAVEGAGPHGQRVDVGLHQQEVGVGAVARLVGLDGAAVVDRHDGGAGAQRLLGEAPGSAADLQEGLAGKLARPARLAEEARLGDGEAAVAVELGRGVAAPLEAEAGGDVVERHEAGHAAEDGPRAAAGAGAGERALVHHVRRARRLQPERRAAGRAGQEREVGAAHAL